MKMQFTKSLFIGDKKEMSSFRYMYLDIVKGWTIISIVIHHITNNLFSTNVAHLMGNPWNVAVFFVLGGYFLKLDQLSQSKTFISKKIKSLYLPATIIYSSAVLLHNLFVYVGWYPLGELHAGNGHPFCYYGIKEVLIGLMKVLLCGSSGELVMGAMWFLYALLYAFLGLWLIWYLIKRMKHSFDIMTFVILSMSIISCVLTQKYSFTISRFSVSLTAMWLIWMGMIVNQRLKWTYDNFWGFLISIVVFVMCFVLQHVRLTMATNQYQDLLHLCGGTLCYIYICCFIARKIEHTIVGNMLAIIGKESLYIMALHILGFFMCNSVLTMGGVFSADAHRGMYTFSIDENVALFLLYLLFGIGVPLVFAFCFRKVIGSIQLFWRRVSN